MNNDRRKELGKLEAELRVLHDSTSDKIDDIKSRIESLRDDEQEYIENMPESMQSGEKYSMAEAAVENMENAISTLDDITDKLSDAADSVAQATE